MCHCVAPRCASGGPPAPPPRRNGGRGSGVVDSAAPVVAGTGVLVELDLLLADLAADRLLIANGLGTQPDPLDRLGLGAHHRPFRAQGDLVLLLRDRRPGVGRTPVGVGDRLPFDPDLLVRHRDGDLLVLGHHVLAQPRPPHFLGLGARPQPLLGAGHRGIGGRAGGVVALGPVAQVAPGVVADDPALVVLAPLVAPGPLARQAAAVVAAVVEAVVAVELLLLLHVQVALTIDVGCVLDGGLVVGQRDPVAAELGALQRHEALVRTEQPGVHGDPGGLVGVVVVVDLPDLAELVAVAVVGGGARDVAQLFLAGHIYSFSCRWVTLPGLFPLGSAGGGMLGEVRSLVSVPRTISSKP